MQVVIGLTELLAFWGLLYFLAGTPMISIGLRLQDWAQRVLDEWEKD